MISAILLAAGESRRMGEFKQLLPLGRKTFVEHCVDNLLSSQLGEVIVVTGYRDSDIRRVLVNRRVRFAHNPEYSLGMASSIKTGMQAVSLDARAFVLALVDQPQIETRVINRIIDEYQATNPLIVIPTYEGKNGHPILLDSSLREEIQRLDPAIGLRQIVKSHSNEIAHVEVSDRSVLEDCDFPEDYRRILKA